MDIKTQNSAPTVYSKIEAIIKEHISSLEFEEVEKAKKVIEQSKVILAEAQAKEIEIKDLDNQIIEKSQDLQAIDEKKKLLISLIEIDNKSLEEMQTTIDNLIQDIVNFGLEKELKQQELTFIYEQIKEKNTEISNQEAKLLEISNSIIEQNVILENRKNICSQQFKEFKDKVLNDKSILKQDKKTYKEIFEAFKRQSEEEKKHVETSLEIIREELKVGKEELQKVIDKLKEVLNVENLLEEAEKLKVEKAELEMVTNSLAADVGGLESTLESLKGDIIIGLEEYNSLFEKHSELLVENQNEMVKIGDERKKIKEEQEELENDKKNFKEVSNLLSQKNINLDNYKKNLLKVVNKAILLDKNSELYNILSLINKL